MENTTQATDARVLNAHKPLKAYRHKTHTVNTDETEEPRDHNLLVLVVRVQSSVLSSKC